MTLPFFSYVHPLSTIVFHILHRFLHRKFYNICGKPAIQTAKDKKFSTACHRAVEFFTLLEKPISVLRRVAADDSGLIGRQSGKDHWARRQQPKVKFQLIGLSGEAASAPAFMRGLAKIFDF